MNMEFISSVEEIIEDQRAGKMVIMVDDENRENEGDLIIPAENTDDQAVNFMAKYKVTADFIAYTQRFLNVYFIAFFNCIEV